MKKIHAVVVVAVVVILLSVSCTATKTCPAYSSNDTEQNSGDNG